MSPGDDEDVGSALERAARRGVEPHEATGTYRTSFDPAERAASAAVISAVSVVDGSDPLDLPPLHAAVDADALDGLFVGRAAGPRRFEGTVRFEYAGYRVAVSGHGTVEVEPGLNRGRSSG